MLLVSSYILVARQQQFDYYYYRLHRSLVNCTLDRLVLHPQCPYNVIGDHVPFRFISLHESL